MKRDLSVVLPVYNEAESIRGSVKLLNRFLKDTSYNYEIIIVDDGSEDGSTDLIRKLSARYSSVKAIVYKPNLGKSIAISKGFKATSGEIVFFIDADLQYSFQDIHKFMEKIRGGYDVVSGYRKDRKDPKWRKVLPSFFYNFLVRSILGPNLPDQNCGFKAFKSDVATSLDLKKGYHRYILPLLFHRGYRIAGIPVKHLPRWYGSSKYDSPLRLVFGLKDFLRVLQDVLSNKLSG